MAVKIVVFASGLGTNFQAIIDNCANGVLPATITHLIVNKKCKSIERAKKHNIPHKYLPFIRSKQKQKEQKQKERERERERYDKELVEYTNSLDCDLIVLAGWMHLLSETFLSNVNCPVINLHPALPGQFPGRDAIGQAWKAFQEGKITHSGIMIHHVVVKMDAGETIATCEIPMYKTDTLKIFRERIRYFEKPLLIQAIHKIIPTLFRMTLVYTGKVRQVYDITSYTNPSTSSMSSMFFAKDMAMIHSDRQSAFDRNICTIPGKGIILTKISEWWFNKTKHIIQNHHLYSEGNVCIVKKCKPFKIEVVVRGYITGSTSTSLWTHYSRGERTYCGITFRDGYKKHQKLDQIVVTPTTKGDHDDPISDKDVIIKRLATQKEWDYIKSKALELFKYGQQVAAERGLILVDTKYEFGKDIITGDILLIDEIHTCDSSRFWLKDSYLERFAKGQEPERFDKDIIRTFIRSKCDPYKDPLPNIPEELIERSLISYLKFYRMLTGEFLNVTIKVDHRDMVNKYINCKYNAYVKN